jgi:alpha-1,2-mannosyltransferase
MNSPVQGKRDALWAMARAIILAVAGAAIIAMFCAFVAQPSWPPDFHGFWSASFLALRGSPADAYDPAAHRLVQQSVLSYDDFAAFFYPPPYLLLCYPLALLPVKVSAMAFLAITGGLFLASIRPLLMWLSLPVFALLALAFAWTNLIGGQNGLLLSALFTFGFRYLDARPVLAGFCLGCIIIKPQFGVVLPFALIASGRWATVVSAGVTALVLIGVSTVAFGTDTWAALLHELPTLHNRIGATAQDYKLLSVLGTARMVGAPETAGDLAQAVMTILCCAFAAIAGRRFPAAAPLGAVVCVAALLATPLLHSYDLAILAFPLTVLATADSAGRASPWMKVTVLGALVWAVAWPVFMLATHAPVTPLILTALLLVTWRQPPLSSGAYPALPNLGNVQP